MAFKVVVSQKAETHQIEVDEAKEIKEEIPWHSK